MGREHLFVIAAVLLLARATAFVAPYPEGHRTRINGYTVLYLAGDGKKMGARRNYDFRLGDLGQRPEQGIGGDDLFGEYDWMSRDELLVKLVRRHYGRIDESTNLLGAQGVPIRSINLHSALLFPDRLAFRVSVGEVPAADQPCCRYRMTERGIVSDE
ncbi:MAG: hypothetical protein HPY44_01405 [Armatimonadetes bacterium]|nr:hypothetical protein [Armatimonadota bacterium]